MKKEYYISGMTCESCVSKVKQVLENFKGIKEANIQLNSPQAIIESEIALNTEQLNQALNKAGNYRMTAEPAKTTLPPLPEINAPKTLKASVLETYKPLFLIVLFIAGVSFLSQYPLNNFSFLLWMRHFMAGFFVVFSFFKLLNLKGFSSSYGMYDIIAMKWKTWGFIYPFLELVLGIFYLINVFPFYTNLLTAVVLGISSIGVIQSNLNKKKIKCACLGDVFNLPMSTITIVEDLTMVVMAIIMLIVHQ